MRRSKRTCAPSTACSTLKNIRPFGSSRPAQSLAALARTPASSMRSRGTKRGTCVSAWIPARGAGLASTYAPPKSSRQARNSSPFSPKLPREKMSMPSSRPHSSRKGRRASDRCAPALRKWGLQECLKSRSLRTFSPSKRAWIFWRFPRTTSCSRAVAARFGLR